MISDEMKQKIIGMLDLGDVVDAKAVIILMSNGVQLQGVANGHEELGPTERVDLVAYLMKRLEISLADIEDTVGLSDEYRYMLSAISRGRLY